jgi:hypothetical protein
MVFLCDECFQSSSDSLFSLELLLYGVRLYFKTIVIIHLIWHFPTYSETSITITGICVFLQFRSCLFLYYLNVFNSAEHLWKNDPQTLLYIVTLI